MSNMNNMDILDQLRAHFENDEYEEFIELLNQNPNMLDHIDLNMRTQRNGHTLLHIAIEFKKIKLIRELIARDSDINILADNGCSSLHIAGWQYYINPTDRLEWYWIVKFLIESGADCNVQNNVENYVLMYFCRCDLTYIDHTKEIIGMLLDHGADRGHTYKGYTPESCARLIGQDEMADFVRDYQVMPYGKGVHDDGGI